jgi:hypothetical protein
VRVAAADDLAEEDAAPSSAHLSFHARASLPLLLLAARVVTTSPDGSLYCLLKTVVGSRGRMSHCSARMRITAKGRGMKEHAPKEEAGQQSRRQASDTHPPTHTHPPTKVEQQWRKAL